MKIILYFILLGYLATACQKTDQPAEASSGPPSIEGSWELVENRVNGKVTKPRRAEQFKMFHDGFFSFIMYNPDGSFHGAGSGTYTLDGNQYTEKFRYYSDTAWVGYSDVQSWELKDDTLLFSGFKKVLDRNGKEMAADTWGGDRFVEKRVRSKP
ncbi:hypothetical protein [Larkinella terrae]|uniref:Lipocalin-like domain-containing protein n=1 Tax=Larkinella terrae TaxID=2025311 RepID=A0A7K0ESR9_9BACT|nr:hypothetical protein [Larkinella terrae]MRS64812.1 hypothetical protein [Larkinella terrae]